MGPRFRFIALVVAGVAALSGCGGTSGTQTSQSSPQTTKLGQATVSFGGQLKPQIGLGLNSVTVTGATASAGLTGMSIDPTQTMANSQAAVVANNRLYTIQNGVTTQISTIGDGEIYDVAYTHTGKIAYLTDETNTNLWAIYTVGYDGSGPSKVANVVNLQTDLAWSPNNSKVVDGGPYGLYAGNSNGSDFTQIATAGYNPTFSSDSSTIMYVASDGTADQIWTIPVAGGSPTQLTFGGDNCAHPCFSPDGQYWTLELGTGPGNVIDTYGLNIGTSVGFFTAPGSDTYLSPVFTPDDKSIAFIDSTTSGDSYVDTAGTNGENMNSIGYFVDATRIVWSPYFGSRTFVGSGGAMYSSASGFLWGQFGSGFAGLLSFTVKTDSTATIASQNTVGGSLVFDVHGDEVTGIKYINSYYGGVVTLTPNLSDALVSFDATTGQVAAVAPYAVARGAAQPLTSVQGSQLVCHARFSGVWNSAGVNVAPSGASQIVLDRKTGKFIGSS